MLVILFRLYELLAVAALLHGMVDLEVSLEVSAVSECSGADVAAEDGGRVFLHVVVQSRLREETFLTDVAAEGKHVFHFGVSNAHVSHKLGVLLEAAAAHRTRPQLTRCSKAGEISIVSKMSFEIAVSSFCSLFREFMSLTLICRPPLCKLQCRKGTIYYCIVTLITNDVFNSDIIKWLAFFQKFEKLC